MDKTNGLNKCLNVKVLSFCCNGVFLSGTKPFSMLVDFQILKKLFPYLNFVAIGLSVTKLIIFYKAFGIDIMQYIEITEALGIFFEDIIWFVAIMLLLIISSIFYLHKIGDENAKFSHIVMEEPNFWKRLIKYLRYNWLSITTNFYFVYLLSPIFIGLIILLYLLSEIRYVLKSRYSIDFNSTYHNLVLWGAIYVGFVFTILEKDITAVKNYGKYHGSEIQVDMPEGGAQYIVADSVCLFLGRTKNHLYLYDNKKEAALIIPSDRVLRVNLKNKYRWFWEYPR